MSFYFLLPDDIRRIRLKHLKGLLLLSLPYSSTIEQTSGPQFTPFHPDLLSGVFDYHHEFYLGPRHEVMEHSEKGEPGGYHSIVPFTIEGSGERVLIDRGWIRIRTKEPVGTSNRVFGLKMYVIFPSKMLCICLIIQLCLYPEREIMSWK